MCVCFFPYQRIIALQCCGGLCLTSIGISHCCCCSVAKSCLFAIHGLQHTRLPCPSLSPAVKFAFKQTSGVSHSYKHCGLVTKLCHTIPCSPPGSSVHWVLQARILEWVAISFSGGWNPHPCIVGKFFTTEPPGKPKLYG